MVNVLFLLLKSVSWTIGDLLDRFDNTKNEWGDKFINATIFRPFEGNLSQEEIRFVLIEVKEKRALILKSTINKLATFSLKRLSKDIKMIKKVKQFIVEHFVKTHNVVFKFDFSGRCRKGA